MKKRKKKAKKKQPEKLDYGGWYGQGVRICTASDMHPYNCIMTTCVHCKGIRDKRHNPDTCVLCEVEA